MPYKSQKQCNLHTPLTLPPPPLYSGFYPRNPYGIVKKWKCSHCIIYCAFNCSTTTFELSFYIATCNYAPIFKFIVLTSSSIDWLRGSTFSGYIYNCYAFYYWSGLHLLLLLLFIHLWFFIFLTSLLEYMWFLNLHLFLLSCPIGPYFIILVLASCFYACWIST